MLTQVCVFWVKVLWKIRILVRLRSGLHSNTEPHPAKKSDHFVDLSRISLCQPKHRAQPVIHTKNGYWTVLRCFLHTQTAPSAKSSCSPCVKRKPWLHQITVLRFFLPTQIGRLPKINLSPSAKRTQYYGAFCATQTGRIPKF